MTSQLRHLSLTSHVVSAPRAVTLTIVGTRCIRHCGSLCTHVRCIAIGTQTVIGRHASITDLGESHGGGDGGLCRRCRSGGGRSGSCRRRRSSGCRCCCCRGAAALGVDAAVGLAVVVVAAEAAEGEPAGRADHDHAVTGYTFAGSGTSLAIRLCDGSFRRTPLVHALVGHALVVHQADGSFA